MGFFSSDEEKIKCEACDKEIKFSASFYLDGNRYCQNCAEIALQKKENKRAKIKTHETEDIIVYTGNELPHFEVEEYLEPINTQVVMGVDAWKELLSSWTGTVGGRSKRLERELESGYQHAIEDLKKEAYLLEADAVIGVELDGGMEQSAESLEWINDRMMVISGVGTAVKLQNHSAPSPSDNDREFEEITAEKINEERNVSNDEFDSAQQTKTKNTETIACSNCGTELDKELNYCTNCGTEMDDAKANKETTNDRNFSIKKLREDNSPEKIQDFLLEVFIVITHSFEQLREDQTFYNYFMKSAKKKAALNYIDNLRDSVDLDTLELSSSAKLKDSVFRFDINDETNKTVRVEIFNGEGDLEVDDLKWKKETQTF